MARPFLTPEAMPDELGIEMAARMAGIPAYTLRRRVDDGQVIGVRRTSSGRRVISREGLLAYLDARGMKPKHLKELERRRDGGRVCTRPIVLAILELPDPEHPGRLLGHGQGRLVDQSLSGLQIKDLAWDGYLPGPGTEGVFRILGGALKGVSGRTSLSWTVYRKGSLRLGLRILALGTPESREAWKAFVRKGLEAKHRQAVEALEVREEVEAVQVSGSN